MSDAVKSVTAPTTTFDPNATEREPRWPAVISALCVAGLSAALPDKLSAGPPWLLPVIVAGLLVPTIMTHKTGHHRTNQVFGYIVTTVLTLFLVYSLARLVLALPQHAESPGALLRSAALLWITNVLVFAAWYWRLDAGGPHARDVRRQAGDVHCEDAAFLFPQMTSGDYGEGNPAESWSPQFVDYLFLAFNTSTALSPTDTAVLSRWAKLLMMVQSATSLTILALLAARAVNIL